MTGHGGDVVHELTSDHRELEELFTQIEATPPGDRRRRELFDDVIRELVRHAEAEEAYVYPAVREVVPGGDAIADRELQEHKEVERLLKDLETTEPTDPSFDPGVVRVMALVRQHVQEEETEMFPALAAATNADDLAKLGEKVRMIKSIAPTRPHPSAPDTPPFNKLLGPGAGLVDRARDFFSGRNR